MKRYTDVTLDTLEKNGYTHIASVVKSIGRTEYFNVCSISAMRHNRNMIIPCNIGAHRTRTGQYINIPIGTIGSKIDWNRTIRATRINYKLSELSSSDCSIVL